ncbi:hypothetical protein ACLOJK_026468 [Asimina triloba]
MNTCRHHRSPSLVHRPFITPCEPLSANHHNRCLDRTIQAAHRVGHHPSLTPPLAIACTASHIARPSSPMPLQPISAVRPQAATGGAPPPTLPSSPAADVSITVALLQSAPTRRRCRHHRGMITVVPWRRPTSTLKTPESLQ